MPVFGNQRLDRALEAVLSSPVGRQVIEADGVRPALGRANRGLRAARRGVRLALPSHRRYARSNPAHPTFGVAMMVQDAAALLPLALAPELLELADDVVVLDGGSRDDTLAVARSLGARTVSAPFPAEGFGLQQTRAAQACRADWVLILDADEVPGTGLLERLPELIRTRTRTGWWLPRRWLVAPGASAWWLDSHPHWPDHQPRLARRDSRLRYVGEVHQTLAADVPGAWGVAAGAPLVHLDLILNSRERRQAKVAARAAMPGFAGTERFYLWEDRPCRLVPVPAGEAPTRRALERLSPSPPGAAPAAAPRLPGAA